MKKYAGEEFLNKIYKDLVNSEIVKHTAKGSNKNEDVSIYMDRLENIAIRATQNDKMSLLKKFYYDKYIIKPENIKESYFQMQEKILLDRGYGHVKYDEATKEKEIESIISEQKSSLDLWIDYFNSEDASYYPTWFKYFCFQGMLKIGYYDKKEEKFTKRTDSTVKPFIEINREAIAMMYDNLIKNLDNVNLDDKNLEKLINNGNFAKLYGYCINKLNKISQEKSVNDEGIWKKYDQNSDPNILFNDIHGKGTGWCTAGGIETTKAHLEGGDFYVYFTKNSSGEYVCPRIAIRTENGKIAEIRGVAQNQNLESNMERVVEKKLEMFPDGDEYKKKVNDMEMLTNIYDKYTKEIELSNKDLRFLYEIDDKIKGFGYRKDPRIDEILQLRNKKKDFSKILNINEEQISTTQEEALSGNILYHLGDLEYYDLKSAENINFPKTINGYLNMVNLKTAKNVTFPKTIHGILDLIALENVNNVIFPKKVNYSILLSNLKIVKNLILPETIDGNLSLRSLTSVENLTLPKVINGSLFLSSLTSAANLKLPEVINGDLYLNDLTTAKGLILSKIINGTVQLGSLKSAEGLVLTETLKGVIWLDVLMDTKGIVFPNTLNCTLWFARLENASGLNLPKIINGSLFLGALTDTKGLVLPEVLNGSLFLNSLTYTNQLILPKIVNGVLSLGKLKTANLLVLPETVMFDFNISSLTDVDNLTLPKKIGGKLIINKDLDFNKINIPDELDCLVRCDNKIMHINDFRKENKELSK